VSGWERLPVDDQGYVDPAEILKLNRRDLRRWVRRFEQVRYGGWRNHDNLWRSTLGLDTTQGKQIIDYGCGYGIEALQFARRGNRMRLFDLTVPGLQAARRVLAAHRYDCRVHLIDGQLPEADIFYANGVLHHFPEGMQVLRRAPCAEARLMLYSDRAHELFGGPGFVRAMDEVGDYADWYSPQKLQREARGWTLQEATYITPDGRYLTARLVR
jgi:SAM-dependent methyltransferase